MSNERWGWRQLAGGAECVVIEPRGHSMEPLIRDRELVTIRRLAPEEPLQAGDIVLVRVRGHVYLHKVSAVDRHRVQISNNHGHVNGWTGRMNVVGRLVR